MIIQCKSCSRKFVVKDRDIPEEGRMVQCGYCSVNWHQMPVVKLTKTTKQTIINKPQPEMSEGLSVDKIKASDGKTYKFLGSQWAELLPSGKTGLFAKKKIAREWDKITGRKQVTPTKKKLKKLEEVDPSLENLGKKHLLSRVGKPEEIGDLVAFMASERSGFVTGTSVVADGGAFQGIK